MKRILTFILGLLVCVGLWADPIPISLGVDDNGCLNVGRLSSDGTEFYLSYMSCSAQASGILHLNLFMATSTPTMVRIMRGNGGTPIDSFYLQSDTIWQLQNTNLAYLNTPDQVSDKTLLVRSDSPISLFMSTSVGQDGAASIVLPSMILDKEYVLQTYHKERYNSEFCVIAVAPGSTHVVITPSVPLAGNSTSAVARPAGMPYTITLGQGDVYYEISDASNSLSGTTICADQPVAVFNGDQEARSDDRLGTSLAIHEAAPIRLLGSHFGLAKTNGQEHNIVQITAIEDTTYVYRNGSVIDTLMAFETSIIDWNDDDVSTFVETSKRAVCFQYLVSWGDNARNGTPEMYMIAPLEMLSDTASFTTYDVFSGTTSMLTYYVNIVAPDTAVAGIMIDNINVSSNFQSLIGTTGYSYARIAVSDGPHTIVGTNGGFVATAYGISSSAAYAFAIGLNGATNNAHMYVDFNEIKNYLVCESPKNQWNIILSDLINTEFDSIVWYDSYQGNVSRIGIGDTLFHTFRNQPHDHVVYMHVNRKSIICDIPVVDVYCVNVYCADMYDVTYDTTFACVGDTLLLFGGVDTVVTDTLPIYETLSYTRHFTTYYGCDSILTELVFVSDPQPIDTFAVICSGERCFFGGNYYTESGVYYDTRQDHGCDYIVTLHLTVNPVYSFFDTVSLCDTELPFIWQRGSADANPDAIWHSVDTTKVYHTVNGCDSIYHLHFTVWDSYLFKDSIDICDTDTPFIWNGHSMSFSESGVYYDSLASIHGCDSAHRLSLTIHPSYRFDEYDTICSNVSYTWRGSTYPKMTGGEYEKQLLLSTVNGCDSLYVLHLLVNDTINLLTNRFMSDVDTVVWDGITIGGEKYVGLVDTTLSLGVHTLTHHYVSSVTGCDSFMTLRLIILESFDITILDTVCQHDGYIFGGRSVSTDSVGTFFVTDSLKTVAGYDSIVTLILTVNPIYYFEDFASICSNETFIWHGFQFSSLSAGTYYKYDSLRSYYGCDSVYLLSLTVNDTVSYERNVVICDVDTFHWDGLVYGGPKHSGLVDSVISVGNWRLCHHYQKLSTGCDSLLWLNVQVNPTYLLELNESVCQGDVYIFGGRTLPTDSVGTFYYVDSLHSIHGCDSVVTLTLTVNPVYLFESEFATCVNVPYIWRTHTYSNLSPGLHNFYDTLYSVSGCDSIYHLALTINDTVSVVRNVIMCDVDTIVWDGVVCAGSKYKGVSDIVLPLGRQVITHRYSQTGSGCDSVLRLFVEVRPTYAFMIDDSICEGDDYWIGPNRYHFDEAGIYNIADTLVSTGGCDSVIGLRLIVNPVYEIVEQYSICSNSVWDWHGIHFDHQQSGSYTFYDSLLSASGCDSVYRLELNVFDTIVVSRVADICATDTIRWDGVVYAGESHWGRSDVVLPVGHYSYVHRYTSSLTGCDSLMVLDLTIHPYYFNEHYTSVCQGSIYSFSTLSPIHCNSVGDFVYVDSLTSVYGCDSVELLHLHVNPVYLREFAMEMCADDTIAWRSHTYHSLSAGVHIFWDSLTTSAGCDSLYKLILTVHPVYHFIDCDTICGSGIYHWRSHYYTGYMYAVGGLEPGEHSFRDTYRSIYGCDSIYELRLMVLRSDFISLPADTVCQGDVYRFCGRDISCNTVGSFILRDTLSNYFGCDSIVVGRLVVHNTYLFEESLTVCSSDTVFWRGRLITALPAGLNVIDDSLLSVYGCDSIYRLNLFVKQSYLFEYEYTMCDYDTMLWRDHHIDRLPIGDYFYYDSLLTYSGCDSVYAMTLHVCPSYRVRDTIYMCSNEIRYYHNHRLIYNVAGRYTLVDTLSTIHGCDSIVEVSIYVSQSYHFTQHELVCGVNSYEWRGRTIYFSGNYYDTLRTVNGCDSIYQLDVVFQERYRFDAYRTICSGDSFYFRGMYVKEAGDHSFTVGSIDGCDSEYVLHLRVLPKFYREYNVSICLGETYTFAGRILRKSGVYWDSLMTRAGCDSVTKLTLNVIPAFHHITYHEGQCTDDTIWFRGKSYTKSGIYYDSLVNSVGCDSVYELRLKMNPKYHFVKDTIICDYSSFRWRGKPVRSSGVYWDSLETKIGCDSIYELRLTIMPTRRDTLYDTICLGENYTFHGTIIRNAGVYADTVCYGDDEDCTITTLFLTTVEPTYFNRVSVSDICADDTIMTIGHTWRGATPLKFSVLFGDSARKQGFRNIEDEDYKGVIEVPVPNYPDKYKFIRPDHYSLTLRLWNGICDETMSELRYDFLVRWPSWMTEQKWQDVVAVVNDKFNGGYTFDDFDWYVNGRNIPSERNSYIYLPERLAIGDEVYVCLTRTGESYCIPTCPIIVADRSALQVSDVPFTLFPSQLPASGIARIESSVSGHYLLIDCMGHILAESDMAAGARIDLQMPSVPGVYMVYFYDTAGRSKVIKVLINNN
ncbi:MAG: IgGFc-binding protein [Paludibacteraceae bacterium]|nr:IgGFc-binding protein [Paludibacteraceae bacterium]